MAYPADAVSTVSTPGPREGRAREPLKAGTATRANRWDAECHDGGRHEVSYDERRPAELPWMYTRIETLR